MRVEKPREIAVRVLAAHAETGRWVEDLLGPKLAAAGLSGPDRALVHELVLGTVRQQRLLDWLIARRTDGREQPAAMRALLRVGLYQLFLLDRIPDHAAVNETVNLARDLGFGGQSGFVNALLRGCLRERTALESEIERLRTDEPDVGYSHPRWLWERWSKRYTPADLRSLLDWNNRPAAVYARVNTLKTSPDAWQARLQAEGVEAVPLEYDWIPPGWQRCLWRLDRVPAIDSLASFREGWFYVQDPSTLLAVAALAANPGDSVLDLCAAPGGKTTAIAQTLGNVGSIVAYDPDPSRRRMIRENCDRLGVTCVRIPEGRPVRPGEAFDRILVDAPCSNTGVMRRRAELRWRITAPEIERLRGVQADLLRQAAAALRPGGTLVYSTCSLEPEENQGLVESFLTSGPSGAWKCLRQQQLSPLVDGVDGAFVAVLAKS